MIVDKALNFKGYSIGGAQISPKHGNFILNNGGATAADYLALINLIQSKVQEKLGFQFELEIKLLGEF
jgi:UDP-N-acetylmuramate dehydrogenase